MIQMVCQIYHLVNLLFIIFDYFKILNHILTMAHRPLTTPAGNFVSENELLKLLKYSDSDSLPQSLFKYLVRFNNLSTKWFSKEFMVLKL